MSDTNSTPRDFYVYLHRKATTGEIFYIGKGQGNRATESSGRSTPWRSTSNKHGLIVEIIQDGLQEWAAFELEQGLIALHGRRDCGYGALVNMTDGGEGSSGRIYDDAAKQRIRDILSMPEIKQKISAGVSSARSKPELKDRFRKIFADPEFKNRRSNAISKSLTGLQKTDSHRDALRAASKMAWASPEINAKLRAARIARGKTVLCMESGVVFVTSVAAADWLKGSGKPKAAATKIRDACAGKQKTAYGYTWRYPDQT
jgi:hypothetical protein